VTGHFCGSNLHPEEEYGLRLGAVRHLADSLGGTLLIDPYRPWDWMEAVRGTEREPEGGERCSLCFAFQFEAAARAALERGCRLLCTTLTISPHKDPARINRIGGIVAERFGLTWLPRIFRKGEGFRRSVEESRRLGLYRQDYCGCVYSRREKKT
jgi:predicted adenine nucleotide alpha hydrolase (AANH) superfamily ATPase